MLLALLIVGLWLALGTSGFVFWWTTDYDFTPGDIPMSLLAGVMGPFAWVAGYYIHGDRTKRPPTVLVKRRDH